MDTASSPKPSLIGRAIAGRFRITGFIGEGAMATVYRGVQEQEPHDVAVKVMHPHLVGDPSFVKRFRREAKAAAVLKHPNTVQIVDYGIDSEMPYIAMELVSGQDLFELLVMEKQLNQALAVRILIQVCDALAAAHDLGIVHRDLKPENVMLIREADDPSMERVKVLDFGIAKIVDRSDKDSDEPPTSIGDSILTTVGVIVGTPQYMSPEQCRAGPIDARSDVYACGILLYQLVTGRLPFTGDHPFEIAMKQVREAPVPPSSVVPSLAPELEKVILKALEKWPQQRHQSARELRNDLAKVLRLIPDDRQVRVSWPQATQETPYGRRAPFAPGATEQRPASQHPSSQRPSSQPTTVRSADVPRSDSMSEAPKPPNIAVVGVRDPLTSTLTSGEAVSFEPPAPVPVPAPKQSSPGITAPPKRPAPAPPRPPAPQRPAPPQRPSPLDDPNRSAATTLAAAERPAILAPLPTTPAPTPPKKRSEGLGWILLPMAIGLGIGVGVLAYLAINFMR